MSHPNNSNNLIINPKKYSYSKVCSTNYIGEYKERRMSFLKKTSTKKSPTILSLIKNNKYILDEDLLLKMQKRFEVSKRFFKENELANIESLALLSYMISLKLNKDLNLSFLSSLLKINDSLLSVEFDQLSPFPLHYTYLSVQTELETIDTMNNPYAI